MSGDNAKDGDNDIEMDCNACGHECHGGSGGDYGNSFESDSDCDSINNSYINYEEKDALRALAMLTCVEDILPKRSLSRHMLCNGNPMFKNKTLGALHAECINIYEEEKVRAKRVLRKLDGKISLSVDVLRCPAAGEYLRVTAHFIDVDWSLRNWVICFSPITRLSDDDFLDGIILKSIIDLDTGHKISNITLENCRVYDEGIDMIKDFVQEKRKLPFDGLLFRLYCCADIFKLMVNDAFKEKSKTMFMVDALMSFGRPTYTWNNAYTKLKEALEFEAKGEWEKEEYEDYDKPSADEWKRVEDICKLLERLYNAANAVFEAKQPTANIYLHNLHEVRTSLAQASVGSDNFISPIAEKMLKKLDKYLKQMFLVLTIATVMDPRYKMKYLEYSFARHGGNDGSSDLTTVLTAIRSLYGDYVTKHSQSRNLTTDSTSFNPGEDSSLEVSDDNSDWLQKYQQFLEAYNKPSDWLQSWSCIWKMVSYLGAKILTYSVGGKLQGN